MRAGSPRAVTELKLVSAAGLTNGEIVFQKIRQILARQLRVAKGPKPTLFVHAGSGQTGTSGIQRFLGENHKELWRLGLEYPIFNTSFPGTSFPWAGNAAFFGRDMNLGKITSKSLDDLAYKIRTDTNNGTQKVLFSGESLSNATNENIHKFVSAFSRYFEIEAIFFLRDPLSWYYSAWKQIIRTKPEARTFENFIQTRKIQQIVCPQGWFDYTRKVHLFSYDEHKKDLLSTFFSAMGIDVMRSFPDVNTVTANLSLTKSEADFLRLVQSVPEFAADMSICQKIADRFLHQPNRKPDVKPDPHLAELAIKNMEPMFAVTDQCLHRSRIIKTETCGLPQESGVGAEAPPDPEHVRIALEVLAEHFTGKETS
jgi:hypothetical protein